MLPYTLSNISGIFNIPQSVYIGKELNKVTTKSKMLTTESGILPYYSEWDTVDAWGLNNPEYSRALIQSKDISTHNPDLIVIHAYSIPYEDYSFLYKKNNQFEHKEKTWKNMCSNIVRGIDETEYKLFMVPFVKEEKRASFQKLSFFVSETELFILYTRRLLKLLMGIRIKTNSQYRPSVRYDAFFVKNMFKHSKKIEQILLKYNAISLQEYEKL